MLNEKYNKKFEELRQQHHEELDEIEKKEEEDKKKVLEEMEAKIEYYARQDLTTLENIVDAMAN